MSSKRQEANGVPDARVTVKRFGGDSEYRLGVVRDAAEGLIACHRLDVPREKIATPQAPREIRCNSVRIGRATPMKRKIRAMARIPRLIPSATFRRVFHFIMPSPS